MSKNLSKNKIIHFDDVAMDAFDKIERTLASDEIVLRHPNFDKKFELTTDVSNYAIGAVLPQDGRPITFLFRTSTDTLEDYATNSTVTRFEPPPSVRQPCPLTAQLSGQ